MNITAALSLIYIVLFFALTAKRPNIALMLTFASAPFQNDLSGDLPVRFSLAEVNLVLTLVLVLIHSRVERLQFGPLLVPIALYFAICLISSLRAWRDSTTISLMQTALYMVVAVLVFSSLGGTIDAYKISFLGLIAVGVAVSVLALMLSGSFLDLGLNKNGVGGSLACCLLVAIELWTNAASSRYRKMLLAAIIVVGGGLVITLSRGAWLGTLAGLVVLFTIKAQFKSLVQTLLVLVPVVAICWMQLPAEAKDFATGFDVKRTNIAARLDSIEIAEKYFETEPFLGVGVGLRKEFDATNIVMTVLAETGILGLIAFMAVHVVFFWMTYTVRQRVLPTSSASSVLGIGGALLTSQLAHGLVDHYWSRGSLMMAWAGVGMVTRCFIDLGTIVPLASAPARGFGVTLPPGTRLRPNMAAASATPRMLPSGRPKPGQWNRPIRRLDRERD